MSMTHDSMQSYFMLTGLYNLKLMAGDIGNAYWNAPNREKVHVRVVYEISVPENEGIRVVICRTLYGLK